jgi:hypothetical protein
MFDRGLPGGPTLLKVENTETRGGGESDMGAMAEVVIVRWSANSMRECCH